jgi:hypothetical protein
LSAVLKETCVGCLNQFTIELFARSVGFRKIPDRQVAGNLVEAKTIGGSAWATIVWFTKSLMRIRLSESIAFDIGEKSIAKNSGTTGSLL